MTEQQAKVLKRFRDHRVRYLVIGGHAMRARGIDRDTTDLDLWIARDKLNAEAVRRALYDMQIVPSLELLQQPNKRFTIGDPLHPDVDILTSVAGDLPFDECASRCERLMLDERRVPVIAVADLRKVKEASAATMDGDSVNANLSAGERAAAVRTAARERRDLVQIGVLFPDD